MNKDLIEKSILGTMIQENYLITESQLQPEMFMGRYNAHIFDAMQQLAREDITVDYLTLSTRLEKTNALYVQYISELLHYANAEKFDDYARLLRQNWREQRKMQILHNATAGDWSIPKIIHLLDETELHGDHHNADITPLLINMSELPFQDIQEESLIVPHIDDLAKLLDGFRPGELTVLAARPSMGKTDVMNNLVLYAGWKGHLPIIFSLEMSKKTLIDRLIATAGNFSRLKMRNPKKYLTEKQKLQWMDVLELVNQSNIHIDDRSSLTLTQIRSQARRIIRSNPEHKPIIFIDYLQIIQPEGDADMAAVAISKISRGLKKMAKELNCPVICLSQLNRNVEARAMKRPVMSDLRDSGSIEQDADIIILLYRASYYEKLAGDQANVLELIVAKNRNGPTGTAFAQYNVKTGHVCTPENTTIELPKAA